MITFGSGSYSFVEELKGTSSSASLTTAAQSVTTTPTDGSTIGAAPSDPTAAAATPTDSAPSFDPMWWNLGF